ncbi:MAG: hypothetical protein DCC58_01900 [Chloroflexi bacterium]|nr:MAG: hypothetical protein DCC58_01900 [Chloroflexota bacterium]
MQDGAEERRERRSWTLRVALFAVLLALLVVFVAENFVVVEVRLLLWRTEARLAWSLLVAGALGFGLGLLFPRLRKVL